MITHNLFLSVSVHAFKYHYPVQMKPKYRNVMETHPSPSLTLITEDHRVLNERTRERQCSVPEHLYFPCMTIVVETHPCCFCFSAEGNECIKANAESCGDCIQVGAKCGWCTDTVSSAHILGLSDSFVCHRCWETVRGNRNSCLIIHKAC